MKKHNFSKAVTVNEAKGSWDHDVPGSHNGSNGSFSEFSEDGGNVLFFPVSAKKSDEWEYKGNNKKGKKISGKLSTKDNNVMNRYWWSEDPTDKQMTVVASKLLNEGASGVRVKRKYTDNHPEVKAGSRAPMREVILEFVGDNPGCTYE